MKTLLVSLTVLTTLPAFAAKIENVSCYDVATVQEKLTPQYLAVIDGFDKANIKTGEEVDVGGLVTESGKIQEQCSKDKAATLMAVRSDLKAHQAVAPTKAVLNPLNAKCKDFVALGEVEKPVAAYWVLGHEKDLRLKNGEIDVVYLQKPIVSLIEECKAKPTASFYDKAKAWLKKTL